MPDAVCLSLKITFGQMEMQKLFTRKRKDPIEALQAQMRSIVEGHGAVTFGVQKLSSGAVQKSQEQHALALLLVTTHNMNNIDSQTLEGSIEPSKYIE